MTNDGEMSDSTSSAVRPTSPAVLLVLISGILFGTIPIFASLLSRDGVSPLVQTWWRLVWALPVALALYYLATRHRGLRPPAGFVGLALAYGGLILVSLVSYVLSISLGTSVAVAVFLFSIQPVVCVVLGRAFLRESITRAKWVALGLSLVGVVALVNPWEVSTKASIEGNLLALVSGVSFAFYVVLTRREETRISIAPGSFIVLILAAAFLWSSLTIAVAYALLPPAIGTYGLAGFGPSQLLLLIGFAALGTAIPYIVLGLGLKTVNASTSGLILMVEPVAAVALGMIVLNQSVTLLEGVGGAIIIGALSLIYLTASK